MATERKIFIIIQSFLLVFMFFCGLSFSSDIDTKQPTNQIEKEGKNTEESRKENGDIKTKPSEEKEKKKKSNLLDKSFIDDLF